MPSRRPPILSWIAAALAGATLAWGGVVAAAYHGVDLRLPGYNEAPPVPSKADLLTPHTFDTGKTPAAEREACVTRGGEIRPVSPSSEACVVTFRDAGRACRDNRDCLGACIAEPNPTTKPPTGRCQAKNVQVGCYSELMEGAPAVSMCRDIF